MVDVLQTLTSYFEHNNRVREYVAHSSKVHSVDWSSDGQRLASGSFDKTVSLFDLEKDRLNKVATLKGHSDSVDQLCWHPSHPDLLATASLDKTVRFWDARTCRNISAISTRGENINICWSPDGTAVAVGNKEDLVTFIDARQHKILTEQGFRYEVNEISWNNDNDLFFLTSGQGQIHVYCYPDLSPYEVLNAHPTTCICIEFDKQGKHFAVGSADALVSIWDANHLACLRTIDRLDWPARTISFSHDGKLLASASEDLLIDIAYIETGEKVYGIPVETPVFTVAFHPERYILAYACDVKLEHNTERGLGSVKVFGLPSS